MTGREWQHGLFVRDRWNVSDKLTLDLGLRWEYYPIMHRADRGLERVDLQTLEVLLGGRGGNDDNVGLKAEWDNFAPRLGAVYRLNENTVAPQPATASPTTRFRGGARCAGSTRPPSRDLHQHDPFGWYNTLNDGIPLITGPDMQSGRVPLPTRSTCGRLKWATSIAAASIRGTPRSSAGCRGTSRLTSPMSAPAGDGGYADLDINAPTVVGGGNASRPYALRWDPTRPACSAAGASACDDRLSRAAGRVNRPFTKGLLLKGAYTLAKS